MRGVLISQMKTAWAGMLDPHGFGALLQADAGVRLLTSRRAAGVLAGVQPRRTDGEDKLPKYQQRRQNSKAVGKHSLRATEKFRVPGPTSERGLCAISQTSQSVNGIKRKTCLSNRLFTAATFGICGPSYRESTQRDVSPKTAVQKRLSILRLH